MENRFVDIEKNGVYRNQTYYISFDKGESVFSGNSIVGGYHKSKDMNEVLLNIQEDIDEFLRETPEDWESLAEKLTQTLVWTGYEDCHVDENIIKPLITNFVKAGFHNE